MIRFIELMMADISKMKSHFCVLTPLNVGFSYSDTVLKKARTIKKRLEKLI